MAQDSTLQTACDPVGVDRRTGRHWRQAGVGVRAIAVQVRRSAASCVATAPRPGRMGGAGEVRTVWGAKARAVQRHFDTEPPVVRAVRTTERLQHAWVPAGPVPGSDASPTSTGRGNRPEANPSE